MPPMRLSHRLLRVLSGHHRFILATRLPTSPLLVPAPMPLPAIWHPVELKADERAASRQDKPDEPWSITWGWSCGLEPGAAPEGSVQVKQPEAVSEWLEQSSQTSNSLVVRFGSGLLDSTSHQPGKNNQLRLFCFYTIQMDWSLIIITPGLFPVDCGRTRASWSCPFLWSK